MSRTTSDWPQSLVYFSFENASKKGKYFAKFSTLPNLFGSIKVFQSLFVQKKIHFLWLRQVFSLVLCLKEVSRHSGFGPLEPACLLRIMIV